jgi:hypothetical protein
MALFPSFTSAPGYRQEASRELRRVCRELEYERWRAEELKRHSAGNPDLALKAAGAEVRVAALRARAAQLRKAAGLLGRAA